MGPSVGCVCAPSPQAQPYAFRLCSAIVTSDSAMHCILPFGVHSTNTHTHEHESVNNERFLLWASLLHVVIIALLNGLPGIKWNEIIVNHFYDKEKILLSLCSHACVQVAPTYLSMLGCGAHIGEPPSDTKSHRCNREESIRWSTTCS